MFSLTPRATSVERNGKSAARPSHPLPSKRLGRSIVDDSDDWDLGATAPAWIRRALGVLSSGSSASPLRDSLSEHGANERIWAKA